MKHDTRSPGHSDWFGVLNINKPPDVTSRDVVNVIQRLVRPAKCGHAGTLDPLATGVLLVCVGPATRLISLLQAGTKVYRAVFQLGATSDTDDCTGRITDTAYAGPPLTTARVQAELQSLTGTIQQVPPAFSAVHVDGRRAYDLARQGAEVTLTARPVRVDRLTLLNYHWPYLELEVVCGSGTYVRSLARDLGQRLQCGGLMTALQRTAVGTFTVQDAVELSAVTAANLPEHLQPAARITAGLPAYRCLAQDRAAVACGKLLPLDPARLSPGAADDSAAQSTTDNLVALLDGDSGQLLAIAEPVRQGSQLQPRHVFCT